MWDDTAVGYLGRDSQDTPVVRLGVSTAIFFTLSDLGRAMPILYLKANTTRYSISLYNRISTDVRLLTYCINWWTIEKQVGHYAVHLFPGQHR
jgi:hypothetical protein